MTPRSLGKILGEYGIRSKPVRIGYESPKGFEIDQFRDAFARYLSSPVTPENSVTRSHPNTGAGLSVTEAKTLQSRSVTVTNSDRLTADFPGNVTVTERDRTKNPSVTLEPLSDKACDRVTEEKGGSAGNKKSVTDDEGEDV